MEPPFGTLGSWQARVGGAPRHSDLVFEEDGFREHHKLQPPYLRHVIFHTFIFKQDYHCLKVLTHLFSKDMVQNCTTHYNIGHVHNIQFGFSQEFSPIFF